MYCKGSASRRQCKEKTKVFSFGIVETQPTLSKGSTNRREYKINSFIFILEVPPTFTAGAVNSANRREYKINLFIFILEVPPTFTAGAVKVVQVEDNAKKNLKFVLYFAQLVLPLYSMKRNILTILLCCFVLASWG